MNRWAWYKARGIGFIFWQSRHMAYHVMLGLLWAWFLRELWGQFSFKWISLSVFGSLLPDADHVLYFTTHGKKDTYSQQVFAFLRNHEWRNLIVFMKNGHKYNTNLSYHNVYFIGILLFFTVVSSYFDWQAGVILFGAMIGHFLFDIVDDVFVLGYINSSWRRWGNGKSHIHGPRHFF